MGPLNTASHADNARTANDAASAHDTSNTARPHDIWDLDARVVDSRFSLLRWATAEDRFAYLTILRTFDRHRSEVRLRLDEIETDVAAQVVTSPELAAAPRDCPGALAQLHTWGVIEISYDAGRVSSLGEYYDRNSLYQLTELGYQAYLAVDSVLTHRANEEVQLERYALRETLRKLERLASAVTAGESIETYTLLREIEETLERLSRRARAFYLMLGELAHQADTGTAELLALKEQLIGHLDAFLVEVIKYRPPLAEAVRSVAAAGTDRLIDLACEADPAVLSTQARRRQRWEEAWTSVVAWFSTESGANAGSQADALERSTAAAIADLARMLRRITESRRGLLGRERQLRRLARWIWACETDAHAAALFSVACDLRSARHLGTPLDDPGQVPSTTSWWDAPPAHVSATLREHGRAPTPGIAARLRDDTAARRTLTARQSQVLETESDAAIKLVGDNFDRVLSRTELRFCLSLLEQALQSRRPITADLPLRSDIEHVNIDTQVGTRWGRFRVRITPAECNTQLKSTDGTLELPLARLTLEAG